MDPNETLRRLRDCCTEAAANLDKGYEMDAGQGELAELFEALDQWLTNGGFLPKAWERK